LELAYSPRTTDRYLDFIHIYTVVEIEDISNKGSDILNPCNKINA